MSIFELKIVKESYSHSFKFDWTSKPSGFFDVEKYELLALHEEGCPKW
jgi:hypothetical protein